MNYPYTLQPLDALMAAQASAGVALGATVWGRRMRPWPAVAAFLVAVAVVTVLPVEPEFLRGLGATLGPNHVKNLLKLAAALATMAMVITKQRRLIVLAVVGEAVLWPITNYIQDCDWDLAAAHLAFFGLLAGVYRAQPVSSEPVAQAGSSEPAARPASSDSVAQVASSEPAGQPASSGNAGPVDLVRGFWRDDAIIAAAATFAACVVCWGVLHGRTNSADEWGNTFQAALFAKLRAFGSVPHCAEAFRSFYVFQYMGRSFSQYTPGWPYFMTPFVALHVAWLAGPASFGLLVAGIARLSRRAAAGVAPGSAEASLAFVRSAGVFAALAIGLSSTALINGASRYPHIFVCALFAWALEALCVMATPPLAPKEERAWGVVLGACVSLMAAARPADGAALGVGLFVYFVYAVVRRRVGWQGIGTAAVAAAFIGGLTLVILRLQLGQWFKTGYWLGDIVYPWNKVSWSVPKANEFRWGIPLASGAYSWWPCSPAIGLVGIALLRGRARRLGFVLFLSSVALLTMYTLLELGRTYDFGYGPRYEFPLMVPMAIGAGVVLAKLWALATPPSEPPKRSRFWVLSAGGPAAIALGAMAIGVVRIAPLIYPHNYADVHEHNRLHDAIDHYQPHHAVVFGGPGLNSTDPMDLTENLPLDLYPDQDVLIAIDRSPDLTRCVQERFKGWTFYRGIPGDPARLLRY